MIRLAIKLAWWSVLVGFGFLQGLSYYKQHAYQDEDLRRQPCFKVSGVRFCQDQPQYASIDRGSR